MILSYNVKNLLKYFLCIFPMTLFCTQSTAQVIQYETETIPTESLVDFQANSNKVKQVIQIALDLAAQKIGYLYGSAEPSAGGMDCSGTIYYLLTRIGIKNVPRSSEELYQWVKKSGHFYSVRTNDIDKLSHLSPGDLLFWGGTYQALNNPCATHVMLYLGKNKQGNHLMAGSSDGRTYNGKQIYGVSVFDFKLPPNNTKSKFLGYSCIPNFTCPN